MVRVKDMNKRYKIVIAITAFLIIILLLLSIKTAKKSNKNSLKEESNSKIEYNSEKGKYYINVGNNIYESEDKESLYIYTIDPTYDPKS